MYFSRRAITEYPYQGVFYTIVIKKPENGDFLEDLSSDGDLLDSETIAIPMLKTITLNKEYAENSGETILLETQCDIQQASKMFNSGVIMADYNVFIPWVHGDVLPFKIGDMFRCEKESYGMSINGRIVGLSVSQLGGVKINIKMSEF